MFEDVEPPPGCGCEQCARRRLTASLARGGGGPGRAGGAARVVAVAAAAGTLLGVGAGAVAAAPMPPGGTGSATGRASADGAPSGLPDAPTSPPGASAGLPPAPLRLTRAQILQRAETWVAAKVPYSMTALWKDGYRQDCSGFVSMAWGLDTNAWTGDLAGYGVRITRDELLPGDILLFHNAADPQRGSHAVIFGGWADSARTMYTGYEQTSPGTQVRITPYAYWSNSSKYVPYRDKYLAGGASPAPPGDTEAFPGGGALGPGADNGDVTRVGALLVGRGAATFYKVGPGSRWSQADTAATAAFQRAQGWTGAAADGLPGPTTWEYLVHHLGHDIGVAPRTPDDQPPDDQPSDDRPDDVPPSPTYPGAAAFRPGQTADAVLALGLQLVAKGFGAHYRDVLSGSWDEAHRRNVEAFQRAQGWSGRAADGYPGPETWRRLFS